MKRLLRFLGRLGLAALVLVIPRLGHRRADAPRERLLAEPPANRRGEGLVVAALLGTGAAGIAFVVAYILGAGNELLGANLALALALLAVALAVAGRNLVSQAKDVEQRPSREHPREEAEVEQLAAEGVAPLNRRRLLVSGGVAAGALGAAALTPLASLGPSVDETLRRSPWRRGVPLVDESGHAIHASDLEVGGFLTAFPSGAAKDALAAPVVVCRVRPGELRLPSGRQGFAPEGLLAFSKICTHAGCAVALFRYPLSPSTTGPGPALVCPCHYSTFDVTRAAQPISGPAVRALPQLPLRLDSAGRLIAAGRLTGRVGPSWWGVREQ
ncbi:MAG: ubiquinol-cytochrome c reductase iron-sulfur subunit [Gaiellales bacterium]|jgi:ubiquinol-cytochrome c reductase iron-sulfur subunit|nr:ubiquinol-cytochrome c reductase iron-sulfur subunit [Gaiellales bacterium]